MKWKYASSLDPVPLGCSHIPEVCVQPHGGILVVDFLVRSSREEHRGETSSEVSSVLYIL